MRKKKKKYTFLLEGCPQKKALCTGVVKFSPKKPNSANRKVGVVEIVSSKVSTFAYIPGEGGGLQELMTVLIKGGRVRDVPKVNFKLIRGKYDLGGILGRRNGRSKYGTRKWKRF